MGEGRPETMPSGERTGSTGNVRHSQITPVGRSFWWFYALGPVSGFPQPRLTDGGSLDHKPLSPRMKKMSVQHG